MGDNNKFTNMKEYSDQTIKPYIAQLKSDNNFMWDEFQKLLANQKLWFEDQLLKQKLSFEEQLEIAKQQAVTEAVQGSTAFVPTSNKVSYSLVSREIVDGWNGSYPSVRGWGGIWAGSDLVVRAPTETGLWLCKIEAKYGLNTWTSPLWVIGNNNDIVHTFLFEYILRYVHDTSSGSTGDYYQRLMYKSYTECRSTCYKLKL